LVATGRRARINGWWLIRATVLVAGIMVLPTQSGGQSLISRGAERALSPSRTGPFAQPLGSPNYASPTGALTLAMSVAFGFSPVRPMSDAQGGDSAVAKLLDTSTSSDPESFNIGPGGSGPTMDRTVRSGIHAVCEQDEIAKRMQGASDFWSGKATSAPPAQFPQGVLREASLANANRLGDPVVGPSGDRTNLSLPSAGPANGWCRPLPVPFAKSSPLANRTVWIAAAFALMIGTVFWLSRGVRVPA
jgi:hypothetical protein